MLVNDVSPQTKQLRLPVQKSSLREVYASFESFCEDHHISGKAKYHLDTAIDEVVTNIILYAYPDPRDQTFDVHFKFYPPDRCEVEFRDRGQAFNPLERTDPDISLPLEQRPIGGLGIFMVKQMMDEVFYQRIGDENVLTIKKQLTGGN